MKKTNRKIKWIACLLCVLTLISAIPLFPMEVEAADPVEYLWGYIDTDVVEGTDTKAGAGTLDVAWIKGGHYQATAGEKSIKASGNHSYTEGIIVYPGMKIWWTDPSDPAGHGEVAAVKLWTDDTYSTLITGDDYFGSREGTNAGEDWSYCTGGSASKTGNGLLMQNKLSTNGICYTYWNLSTTPKYITLSYKGKDAVPIFYSAGEPQLLGEDDMPLPRKLLQDVTWERDQRLVKNGSTFTLEDTSAAATKSGYLLSSAIPVEAGQSIALFSDRTLNGQTGADSQIVEANPTYTFAAFSNADATEASFLSGASVDISSAKINKGPIANTGVVVYQYTNNTPGTVYVRVSYCCTEQRGSTYRASNVYLYESFESYKPIRTNTQVVTGYFSTEGATTVNKTVKTPSAPSKTQGGLFFGWRVEYKKGSTAMKEYYPPETELNVTMNSATTAISSEIKMTPVYLDAPPFTYDGASVRTLMPTGLQFKLYFRKSDFDKMVDKADATKGSLSVGAFAVPESHLKYFFWQNGITVEGASVDTVKNQTLSGNTKTAISENFTMEWYNENADALRSYASGKLGRPYTAQMYMAGSTDGTYTTTELIDDVEYCVAYYTLAGSYAGSYFSMNFAARPYLVIRYEHTDENGTVSYQYSDPVYGEFKSTNIRNTEEVMMACLRDRNPDAAGIYYFTESKTEMEDDIEAGGVKFGKWRFDKEGIGYSSFEYRDPLREDDPATADIDEQVVKVYTRRYSGPTLSEFSRILAGTKYDPAKKN